MYQIVALYVLRKIRMENATVPSAKNMKSRNNQSRIVVLFLWLASYWRCWSIQAVKRLRVVWKQVIGKRLSVFCMCMSLSTWLRTVWGISHWMEQGLMLNCGKLSQCRQVCQQSCPLYGAGKGIYSK